MSVCDLIAGMLVLLVFSAVNGDAYILSDSKAKADQPQNEEFASQNGEAKDNYEVHNIFEDRDEGEEEMLRDVDGTGQENVQYHDAEDSSDEKGGDDGYYHGGHDQEDEEEIDFGDNMGEHHFAISGFEVDIAVHVGGHHGADEHYFGGDGGYDADEDDNRDDNNEDKDDHGMNEDHDEHEND